MRWDAFVSFATATVAQTKRRDGSLGFLLVAPDLSQDNGGQEELASRALAETLLRTIRVGDMVGRRERQTFAVLAQDALQAGAWRLAERIKEAVPQHLSGSNGDAPLTVSQGIATLPQAGTTVNELVTNAAEALAEAIAQGGNQARMCRASAAVPRAEVELREPVAPAAEPEHLAVKRGESLAHATRFWERGEIEGIAIQTESGACPTCLDAARDLYLPQWVPSLPLAGCSGPVGCRCVYSIPPVDPHKRPPPPPAAGFANLEIPRKLRDAALFGSDPRGSSKPDDLAEYLDNFPLLPFEADLDLHEGEVAYLVRNARVGWEQPSRVTGANEPGPTFPIDRPLVGWVKNLGRPPALPGEMVPVKDEGIVYLTNWRIIFNVRGAIDSVLLADVTGIQYFRDGLACLIHDRNGRLVIALRDPLQVGLYFAQTLRDIAALAR
ncbi:MAG: diguanylate cyclase domain-containing protein [Dehalococcoidia bacterium]